MGYMYFILKVEQDVKSWSKEVGSIVFQEQRLLQVKKIEEFLRYYKYLVWFEYSDRVRIEIGFYRYNGSIGKYFR